MAENSKHVFNASACHDCPPGSPSLLSFLHMQLSTTLPTLPCLLLVDSEYHNSFHHKKTATPQPVGSMPCSSAMTSQNLAPIWLPHCPPESGFKTALQIGCNRKEFIFDKKMCPKITGPHIQSKGFLLNLVTRGFENLQFLIHSFPQFYPFQTDGCTGKKWLRNVTILNKRSFNPQKPYIPYSRSYLTKCVPPTTAKHQTFG